MSFETQDVLLYRKLQDGLAEKHQQRQRLKIIKSFVLQLRLRRKTSRIEEQDEIFHQFVGNQISKNVRKEVKVS